jgi:predicted NBD/HSP70 family sugar kinase
MKYILNQMSPGTQLSCVEIGGSSIETVLFGPGDAVERVDGAVRPHGSRLAIACPGLIGDGRVLGATNLGWFDVDPAEALHLGESAEVLLNDAEAAALGEAALRGVSDLVFICVGTGVGGAVVVRGQVVAGNLLGHIGGFSEEACSCGRIGCLETVAAGWALPEPLTSTDIDRIAQVLALALEREPTAAGQLVVLGGGIAKRYPALCGRLAEYSPDRRIEPSAAPADYKSAAAWGLRQAVEASAVMQP